MSSPAAQRIACAPASQPVFPFEILEEIFLRLDAADDLARASAACTAFHRVVSAPRFLRRFRCLHPTPALGLLEFGFHGPFQFHPAEPPHPSAPAARALARAADLTFSFLGDPDRWRFCDARDGRVLLCRLVRVKVTLMVCDPLHRRQVQLPPIPGDPLSGTQDLQEFDSFLDPATDMEKEQDDFSFRVIFAVKNQHNFVTFHFSSATGKWRGSTFNIPVPLGPYDRFHSLGRYYAHGCCFLSIGDFSSFMVMLNMHDMKLSVVDLPPAMHHSPRARAIVEAGEGRLGLFTISDDMLQLYCKPLQGTEWHHERIIPLPKLNSYWSILNAAAGYLLLEAMPRGTLSWAIRESQYFTLNLKTFLVEGLCVVSSERFTGSHLYASFLLPFSQPSV